METPSIKSTSIDVDKVEFDDVPLELEDDDAEKAVEKVFNEEADRIKERKSRMKQKPPALKLRNKQLRTFKAKDYIIMRCNICEKDMTTARKDDDGNFEPRALCQHLVFKGLIAEK